MVLLTALLCSDGYPTSRNMNAQAATSRTAPGFTESYYLEHAVGCGCILIADDHAFFRELIAKALMTNGYRVDCAEDGEDAWDALCRKDFDLLITDHDMPRLTGLDLLRRVRASPFELPAILISGMLPTDAEGFEEILAPGAALAKPFSLEQLLQVVNTILLSQPESFRSRA